MSSSFNLPPALPPLPAAAPAPPQKVATSTSFELPPSPGGPTTETAEPGAALAAALQQLIDVLTKLSAELQAKNGAALITTPAAPAPATTAPAAPAGPTLGGAAVPITQVTAPPSGATTISISTPTKTYQRPVSDFAALKSGEADAQVVFN